LRHLSDWYGTQLKAENSNSREGSESRKHLIRFMMHSLSVYVPLSEFKVAKLPGILGDTA